MKKKFISFSFAVLLSAIVQAQSIPNAGFENWSIRTYYQEPDVFSSFNSHWEYLICGKVTVTRSTDSYSGTYAAKIETVSSKQDTIKGMLFIGQPGNQTINGGYPFSYRPDTFVIHAKYNILANDTGQCIVAFKRNDTIIATVVKSFVGTNSTYTEYKIPITWTAPGNPDTIVSLITSSNLDYPGVPGSTLYLDELSFKDSTAIIAIPNGDFELWKDIASEEPDNWVSMNQWGMSNSNHSATKTTDSYDGTYALKLKNIVVFDDTMGVITNGIFGEDGPEGGMLVSLNPEKVTGYYKYIPVGPDTALAAVFSFRYDNNLHKTIKLDSTLIKLTGTTTYTYFEVPLAYNNFPYTDTVNVCFASGNCEKDSNYVGLGSTLYIDKLNITYKPVGITENAFNTDKFVVYPNPANDKTFVQFNTSSSEDYILSIFDSYGKLMMKESYSAQGKGYIYKINLSSFAAGIYLFNVKTNTENYTQKVIVY
ncbi:MAG: T9SS type A sorting domain-containing protein [Bacteroidota bacterium]